MSRIAGALAAAMTGAAFALLLPAPRLEACFAVVAGKGATADGSVLVAHSELNDPPPQFQELLVVPRGPIRGGEPHVAYADVVLPEGGISHRFLWSHLFVSTGADAVMNEHGVVCVSDASRTKEIEAGDGLVPDDESARIARWRLRIEIARRARTAREGLRIVESFMAKVGYSGGGVTLVVADPAEAWIVALARGRRWVAERVPDEGVVVIANTNVIREVDLGDSGRFRGSADLVEFAARKGWYDPGAGRPFDFRVAYDDPFYRDGGFVERYGCDPRQWRGQCLVTGRQIPLPAEAPLPFVVRPDRKLTVGDLRDVLSDHLEGTPFDATEGYALGSPHDRMTQDDGMICNQGNQEAAVFQLRGGMPPDVGCVYWRASAASCSGVLVPWYAGTLSVPEPYGRHSVERSLDPSFHFSPPRETFVYDPDHAFWIFNTLENLVDLEYGKLHEAIRQEWAAFEARAFAAQPTVEAEALALCARDGDLGRAFLTRYSGGLAFEAITIAKGRIREIRSRVFGY
jgi:dipeptidase